MTEMEIFMIFLSLATLLTGHGLPERGTEALSLPPARRGADDTDSVRLYAADELEHDGLLALAWYQSC